MIGFLACIIVNANIIIIHYVHIFFFGKVSVFTLIKYIIFNLFFFVGALNVLSNSLYEYSLIMVAQYLLYSVVYLHVFMAMDRSVSVRILCELYFNNFSIEFEDLLLKYEIDKMFKKRLDYLEYG